MSRLHRSRAASADADAKMLPLVVSLNCLEDSGLEQESLAGIADVEHVGLNRIAEGRIESASAVLIHSLVFLPRAAQRRLQPWQLILCLGSVDRAVDSALAADLGLRLVHVDASRAEEVADTVMALFLGLLRRTHVLSRHAFSSSGWLGSVQPLCRGMRRCRGLVLGIVGRSASAKSLATRSLAFRMTVLYFDVNEGKGKSGGRISFPSAARKMDTLNDLLAASDLIFLHCALSEDTVQIINAECLQHIKPGAFIVNTGSSQLLDDCAMKQLLIDGTIAGCALDGAEGPQWMEAWVKEMPNVLILPRSADYSEEVWMEIREKVISMLQSFFLDGVFPSDAVSGSEGEMSEIACRDECFAKKERGRSCVSVDHSQTDESQVSPRYSQKENTGQFIGSHVQYRGSGQSQNAYAQSEEMHGRSRRKGRKRHSRHKSEQKFDDRGFENRSNCTSQLENETSDSGREHVWSSSSRFTSPEGLGKMQMRPRGSTIQCTPEDCLSSGLGTCNGLLKDGYVIALHARNRSAFYVSRQRITGGVWFLDAMSDVTKRDPAAQFLVILRSKNVIGLRSFAAGGKLLQINRQKELVFASHSFDVRESWNLEGSQLNDCKLVSYRNNTVILDVYIEILAAMGEDGVARWLD